jgi:hypothetical protein
MEISFNGFGRPLRNPVHMAKEKDVLIAVVPLL